jgi:hypothetical protein
MNPSLPFPISLSAMEYLPRLAALAWSGGPLARSSASAVPHADLLRAPHQTFPSSGRWSETWRAGAAANRRIAGLRRALFYVRQDTTSPCGLTPGPATVEVTYAVPHGAKVLAIEVVTAPIIVRQ